MVNKEKYIKKIRRFDRFYTALTAAASSAVTAVPAASSDVNPAYSSSAGHKFQGGGYSATERSVLFEINSCKKCTAKSLSEKLCIDKGYMSKIIKIFENSDLITKEPSDKDRRVQVIKLTPKGKSEVKNLISLTNARISAMISGLGDDECRRICKAMEQIMECFSNE